MAEIENPRIRPIGDLLQENFFVPRYQRGYRWGKQEITELLDDILQYFEDSKRSCNKKKAGKFYCLQPIVVKAKKWKTNNGEFLSGWELIDGQQRLTTLFIILTYLEEVRQFYDNRNEVFSIDFETRENCKPFFDDKLFINKIDDTNVDFFHISNAFQFVKNWFKNKLPLRLDILRTILNTENNVSVIWYEAIDINQDNDESSIELFTRLNDGKIPLTDAELIKALMLQADLYPTNEERFVKQRLFEIASEWDEIEATLQDEKFWLFLNDTDYKPSSKIEYIFNILSEKWNVVIDKEGNVVIDEKSNVKKLIEYEITEGKPKHFEFLVFDKYLANKRKAFLERDEESKDILEPVNEIWKEIKEMFSTFHEWYNDHNLYHYLGFLLAIEKNKDELIRELIQLNLNKDEFENNIKARIGKAIKITKKDKDSDIVKQLNQIAYNEDNPEIIKVLLLFNINALIEHKKENAKFPFHLYKKEKITSIEHIHPQNPPSFDSDEERTKIWLTNHRLSLLTLKNKVEKYSDKIDAVVLKIDRLLAKYDKEAFKNIFSEIIELYTEMSDFKENELHTLYNLALVDRDTNSQLNNSFFDIKREILKENKLGRYIPICTQRAFSKFYSESPNDMIFWNNDDRQAYYNAIEQVYISFINLIPSDNGN